MKASDILLKRAEGYANGDFEKVYKLYSSKSELIEYFRELEQYVEHAEQVQSKCSIFKKILILEEKSRGNLAQVVCTEYFEEQPENKQIKYLTTSVLSKENGEWKILSEKRVEIEA